MNTFAKFSNLGKIRKSDTRISVKVYYTKFSLCFIKKIIKKKAMTRE